MILKTCSLRLKIRKKYGIQRHLSVYLFTKTFGKIKTVYTPVFLTNVAADKPPSKVEDQPNQTAIPKEFYIYYYMVK